MKLRTKIVLLATIPVLILGIVLYIAASSKIRNGIFDEAYTGMHATTLAVREIFDTASTGEYQVDEAGQLWKGDLNISEANELVDKIKDSTGMDVTVFYGNIRYLTTIIDENGMRQVGTEAGSQVTETVLNQGNDYMDDQVDILGTRYICYYIPVLSETSGKPIGMIFLGEKYSNVYEVIQKAQMQIFTITLFVLIAAILIAVILVVKILNALGRGMDVVQQIADGKLGITIDKKLLQRKDIIGDMCRGISNLDHKLSGIIEQIQIQSDTLDQTAIGCAGLAGEVISAMEQIDETVQGVANATTSEAQDAVAAGDSVSTMGDMIGDTTLRIEELMQLLEEMGNASTQSRQTLDELNNSMSDVKEAIKDISAKTSSTNESVKQISEAANAITEIAEQTNLLSLNASIEAARAGDQGRGFAVVASEIQKLADQSNQSAHEIQIILDQLKEDSESTVNTMSKVTGTIEIQENRISEANDAFQIVDDGIHKSVNGIEEIEKKTEILGDARTQTVGVVQNVAAIAEENAASTEEMAATVDQVCGKIGIMSEHVAGLKDVAEVLFEEIKVFQIAKG